MDSESVIFLGIKTICKKLKISRSSLERLRSGKTTAYVDGKPKGFPKPSLTIGKRPLWSSQLLNNWIN